MKKILAVFAVIILAVAAGCYGYYVKAIVPQEAYTKAEEALEKGDYDAALDDYKDAGDYKDASSKIKMITAYQNGLELMENGSLKKAAKQFDKTLSYGDEIDCEKLRDRCKKYSDFKRTLKAEYKVDRQKESAYEVFGSFSYAKKTDLVLHLNVRITKEGKVEYLAYADNSKKEDASAYQVATYVKSSDRYEWTVDDSNGEYSSIAYSYHASENYLKVGYYDKTSGRMIISERHFF